MGCEKRVPGKGKRGREDRWETAWWDMWVVGRNSLAFIEKHMKKSSKQ